LFGGGITGLYGDELYERTKGGHSGQNGGKLPWEMVRNERENGKKCA